MPARKKITDTPDGPKPKRVMTPEQLEKLAAAREKAKAVKDAMKSENDDHKIRILQAKMDAIKKTSKKKPDPPEQMTDLEEEPLVPEPNANENLMTEPEPEPNANVMTEPEQMTEPEPKPKPDVKPVKQKLKKGKKPVVIVDESNSDTDSDDNSNVIYIRRKKKKPQETLPPPSQTAVAVAPEVKHPPANPFFTYQWSHKNFQ